MTETVYYLSAGVVWVVGINYTTTKILTMNKKNIILYVIIVYLTIISIVTSLFLIESIGVILAKSNIALIISLLVNLTMTVLNVLFFRMRRYQKDFRLILLYNSIYSLIYGIGVQVAGLLIVNYSGFNFSVFYV